jgi:hypothetical protein
VYLAPPQRPNLAVAPSTAPRDTYSVLIARAPSPGAIQRRKLAAKPRRTAGTREQACQERGRHRGSQPRCWLGGDRRTANLTHPCSSQRRGTCHENNFARIRGEENNAPSGRVRTVRRAWKLPRLARFCLPLRPTTLTEPLGSHNLLHDCNAFTGFQGIKGPHISPFW